MSAPYASLPRLPADTILYDRIYNDDLASIKVQLMNALNNGQLPNMPTGFPFRIFSDGRGGSYVSRESYEFEQHFCPSDHRARRQTVTFSYTAPSSEREKLTWRITVPSRESSLNGIPSRMTIAEVTVDCGIMELQYGVQLQTQPLMLLRSLSRSIELGVLITINIAKTSRYHPTDRNLDYNPGDIIYIATDNHRRWEVVRVVKLQA